MEDLPFHFPHSSHGEILIFYFGTNYNRVCVCVRGFVIGGNGARDVSISISALDADHRKDAEAGKKRAGWTVSTLHPIINKNTYYCFLFCCCCC